MEFIRNKKMDNINFQGRTVLVTSPQKYAQRMENLGHRVENVLYCNNMRGKTRKCAINDGDLYVLVHNGQDGALRRIEYDRQLGAQSVIANICEDLQNFGKNIKENITCVIMGGRSRDSVTTRCVNEVADSVETYLENNGKKGDLSIICGLTDELKTPIFIDCNKSLKAPEIYIPAKVEGEVSAEKLEDVFDMVELNNVELI